MLLIVWGLIALGLVILAVKATARRPQKPNRGVHHPNTSLISARQQIITPAEQAKHNRFEAFPIAVATTLIVAVSTAFCAPAKVPYRICVAVVDTDGSGELSCLLSQCLGEANQLYGAQTHACSPSEQRKWDQGGPMPQRCLTLPMRSGFGTGICDQQGPLHMDFHKGDLAGLGGQYKCEVNANAACP